MLRVLGRVNFFGRRRNKIFNTNFLQPEVELSRQLRNFGTFGLVVVKLFNPICPNLGNLVCKLLLGGVITSLQIFENLIESCTILNDVCEERMVLHQWLPQVLDDVAQNEAIDQFYDLVFELPKLRFFGNFLFPAVLSVALFGDRLLFWRGRDGFRLELRLLLKGL